MKRRKESIIFIIISIFLMVSIYSVRSKSEGKSSRQVKSAIEFLNTLKDEGVIGISELPKAEEFKEVKSSDINKLNKKYTVIARNYVVDLNDDYNVIGFLDENSNVMEGNIISHDELVKKGEIYLKKILNENFELNDIRTTESQKSHIYTLSFYKYYKKYLSFSNEVILQINSYTGKLISYTDLSDNKVNYNSDIEVKSDKLKNIATGYFEVLGLKGELINNSKLGYFIVSEGQAQLCYILNYKILDGEEKDKIYKVVINGKDGTVLKHY